MFTYKNSQKCIRRLPNKFSRKVSQLSLLLSPKDIVENMWSRCSRHISIQSIRLNSKVTCMGSNSFKCCGGECVSQNVVSSGQSSFFSWKKLHLEQLFFIMIAKVWSTVSDHILTKRLMSILTQWNPRETVCRKFKSCNLSQRKTSWKSVVVGTFGGKKLLTTEKNRNFEE